VLVGVTVVAVVLASVVLVVARRESFAPGSVHDTAIAHQACAYWVVSLDNHQWRNTRDVPATWTSPTSGQLRVVDEFHAEFTAGGSTVPMWGGDMKKDPPLMFRLDCPETLNR